MLTDRNQQLRSSLTELCNPWPVGKLWPGCNCAQSSAPPFELESNRFVIKLVLVQFYHFGFGLQSPKAHTRKVNKHVSCLISNIWLSEYEMIYVTFIRNDSFALKNVGYFKNNFYKFIWKFLIRKLLTRFSTKWPNKTRRPIWTTDRPNERMTEQRKKRVNLRVISLLLSLFVIEH